MFRFRILAVVGCLFAGAALFVQAQDDDLKAVLRKAIKAHGGEQVFTKYAGVTSKYKGTIEIMGKSRDISGETYLLKPDKLKTSITLDFDGIQIPILVVYNGKKLWRSVMNKTEEVKDEKVLAELRETMLTEGAGSLPDFLKEPYKLSSVGEVKVKNSPAIGIRVSKKGQRDITYYFDKKTHLLAKTEVRSAEPGTDQEVTQEKFIVGYREVDGMKVGARVVIHKDGNPFMDLEITETKVYEKLEESNFDMP